MRVESLFSACSGAGLVLQAQLRSILREILDELVFLLLSLETSTVPLPGFTLGVGVVAFSNTAQDWCLLVE